jgi:glycosyltransferase involved in cell wall biosynthesis
MILPEAFEDPMAPKLANRTKLEPGFLHMKILVSAIACCPLFGSESYVGWSAVFALASNHELWVIINNQGKEGVQAAVAKGEVPTNIHFIYHGRSKEEFDRTFLTPWHPNRLIGRLANWLNYLEWNNGLLELARKLHAQIGFDLIHHVTYATWRVGSPLVCLGVPFVWGPISGGENLPLPFLSMLSAEGAAFELLRKISDMVSTFSPAVRKTARLSSHIFAANKETESRAVELRGQKIGVSRLLQVFFRDETVAKFCADQETKSFEGTLRFFAGGMLEGRKGVALAIRAFSELDADGIPFDYIFGGDGPERRYLISLTKRLGLSGCVHFNDGFYGDAYVTRLKETHIYLMPSLRDGASITLMEAMLAGCVPIVLDAGGPGEIVNEECGFKIRPLSTKYVIEQIRKIILTLHKDRTILRRLSQAAAERISQSYGVRNYLETIGQAYAVAAPAKHQPPPRANLV